MDQGSILHGEWLRDGCLSEHISAAIVPMLNALKVFTPFTLVFNTLNQRDVARDAVRHLSALSGTNGALNHRDRRTRSKIADCPDGTPDKLGAKYVITSKQLQEQAELVARSQCPNLGIPAHALDAITRAIEARKKCLYFHRSYGKEEEASNKGHAEFIELLEKLLEILTPISEVEKSSRPCTTSTNQHNEDLAPIAQQTSGSATNAHSSALKNRFASLEIDEGSDDAKPYVSPHEQQYTDLRDLLHETIDAATSKEEDWTFEIFCFFQDLVNTRKHMIRVWERYRGRQIDLITATITTAAVKYKIKDMEEDLAERCFLFSEHAKCHFDILASNFSAGGRRKWKTKPEIGLMMRELVDFTETSMTLTQFAEAYQHMPIQQTHPMLRTTAYTVELVGADTFTTFNVQEMKDENSRLSKLLMDHAGINLLRRNAMRDDKTLTIEDIFSQGLNAVLEKNQITIWTVLACRALSDAQKLLSQDIERPRQELTHQASNVARKLDLRLNSDKHLEARDGWHWGQQGSDAATRAWFTVMLWIAKNPFVSAKKDMLDSPYKEFGGRSHSELENLGKDLILRDKDSAYFFKQDVFHSGTMMVSLTLDLEEAALGLPNAYGVIFFTTYLYQAGKQLGWIDLDWLALDNTIRQQQEVLFGSNLPTTLKEVYGLFRGRVGMRAVASAPKRRVNERLARGRMPSLNANAVFSALRRHYDGAMPMNRCILEVTTLHSSFRVGKPASGQQETLLPVQVLTTFEERVQKALEEINYIDYLSLTRKCISLIRSIRSTLNKQFGNPYYFDKDESEPQTARRRWSEIVAHGLQGTTEALEGQVVPHFTVRDRPEPPSFQKFGPLLLKAATEVINETLKPEAPKAGAN